MIEKQRATLKVSLIPLVIIILLILGVGYFLLQGEFKFQIFNKEPTVKRLEGFPTTVSTTNKLERQRRVITSDQELNDFLNYVDSSGLLQVKDKINFNKEIVIAVSTETNDYTGYKTKIKKVYEDKAKKRILVSIEDTVLGDKCKLTPGMNVAVDIITLSKSDWEIKFDRIQKTDECN